MTDNPYASEPYEPDPFAAYGDEDSYVDGWFFDLGGAGHGEAVARCGEVGLGSARRDLEHDLGGGDAVVAPNSPGFSSSEVHDWWLARRLRRAQPEQRQRILAQHFVVLAQTKQ